MRCYSAAFPLKCSTRSGQSSRAAWAKNHTEKKIRRHVCAKIATLVAATFPPAVSALLHLRLIALWFEHTHARHSAITHWTNANRPLIPNYDSYSSPLRLSMSLNDNKRGTTQSVRINILLPPCSSIHSFIHSFVPYNIPVFKKIQTSQPTSPTICVDSPPGSRHHWSTAGSWPWGRRVYNYEYKYARPSAQTGICIYILCIAGGMNGMTWIKPHCWSCTQTRQKVERCVQPSLSAMFTHTSVTWRKCGDLLRTNWKRRDLSLGVTSFTTIPYSQSRSASEFIEKRWDA